MTHTTHYSIVDDQGNAVSVTDTLNDWFGTKITAAKTGILLNDEVVRSRCPRVRRRVARAWRVR